MTTETHHALRPALRPESPFVMLTGSDTPVDALTVAGDILAFVRHAVNQWTLIPAKGSVSVMENPLTNRESAGLAWALLLVEEGLVDVVRSLSGGDE